MRFALFLYFYISINRHILCQVFVIVTIDFEDQEGISFKLGIGPCEHVRAQEDPGVADQLVAEVLQAGHHLRVPE